MPSYELALLFRKLGRQETANVLKRTALNLFKNQGVLFGIENLGIRPLPFAVASFGKRYREGSFFIMRVETPASTIDALNDEYKRDIDILRSAFVRDKVVTSVECTLDEELKPPAYREDVKQMIEEGRKKERGFDSKSGLKYSPFNR